MIYGLVTGFPVFECFHLELAVKALHIDFADTLGAAHDVGGVHGLVRRNHDKLLDAVFYGHVGNNLCAVNVVDYGLGRVVLHHWDMLVRSGMEDIIRPEIPEDIIHSGTAADAGYNHLAGNIREVLGHHKADVVLGSFGLVDEHHAGGLELRHLPYYLHADRTSRAGYKHLLADKETLDGFHVHIDFRTGK